MGAGVIILKIGSFKGDQVLCVLRKVLGVSVHLKKDKTIGTCHLYLVSSIKLNKLSR